MQKFLNANDIRIKDNGRIPTSSTAPDNIEITDLFTTTFTGNEFSCLDVIMHGTIQGIPIYNFLALRLMLELQLVADLLDQAIDPFRVVPMLWPLILVRPVALIGNPLPDV